jgi:hypothetical protein
MFPNPQDALPLPSHPSLEQYKKRAKDLVKAANSGDAPALRNWITEWVHTAVRSANLEITDQLPVGVDQWSTHLEEFVLREKSGEKLSLSTAQFVIARAHGFESWPRFAKYLEALVRSHSSESKFEGAVEAIVGGDITTLKHLVRQNPELVHSRSTREHRATLLHYVAANGVESYRQKTPPNAVEIAKLLLDHGADVNAEAEVYGGGATTLELVATSIHPERAGVQDALMQLLLDRGSTDKAAAGHRKNLIGVCLANGRLRAAEFLEQRGFPLDLEAAAGLGRIDLVRSFFDAGGNLTDRVTKEQMERGFAWACEYGRVDVMQVLIERGASLQAGVGGQTPLHCAVMGGHVNAMEWLLAHGANLETKNGYGGSVVRGP